MLKDHHSIAKKLLKQELLSSLSCVESASVSLAAAAAFSLLDEVPIRIFVNLDIATFKNSTLIGLPGTSERGPALAAAAGVIIGDPGKGLGIYRDLEADVWEDALELSKKVTVSTVPHARSIYVRVLLEGHFHKAEAVISRSYDRLTSCRRDGVCVFQQRSAMFEDEVGFVPRETIKRWLDSPATIVDLAKSLPQEDLKPVEVALEINRSLAKEGIQKGLEPAFRKMMKECNLGDKLNHRARGWVGMGIAARNAGTNALLESSGGSGIAGLVVTLGPWALAQSLGIQNQNRIYRAIAMAHFFNLALKTRMGHAGALCGGILGSTIGVSCAAVWLMGGSAREMKQVIRFMMNTQVGALCDGTRSACIKKVTNAMASGINAARLATSGGLDVASDVEIPDFSGDTLDYMVALSRDAFKRTGLFVSEMVETHPDNDYHVPAS